MANVLDKNAFFAKLGYTPHSAGQRSYHASKARFRVPVCGRRYGKSKMAGTDLEPHMMMQNKLFWIIGPTYDLGEKEFRVVWNDLIINQKFGQSKLVKKRYSKDSGDMFIEMPWGTRVEVRSAQYPDTLVGDALDGVIMSEAAKHKRETWEKFVRPSLSDKRGWATFPTTPEGFNWLYELWQLGQNPDFPDWQSWRFPSWDNPVVFPGGRDDPEIKLIEITTSPEWFMQEIGADFSSFVGKIYGEWDEKIHVQKHVFNPAWPNYIAFDFGFVNPLAAIEFQVDPNDNIYIWREHYKSYVQLADHIGMLKAREQPEGYHINCTFGDAADPEGIEFININFAPCIGDPLAKANWREGIDLVKSFLKEYETGKHLDDYGTPEIKPKLFVDHSCVNTIFEFNNYRANDTDNASQAEANKAGAANKKTPNHALDAIRYGLMHVFKLGAGRFHLADVQVAPSRQTSTLFTRSGASDLLVPVGASETGIFTMRDEF